MGVYGSTTFRVKRGWGNILESEWPYANSATWPPIEPPGLDVKAKQYRILRYQRVTNTHECKLALPIHGGVAASFEITEQWIDADNGVIEMPAEGDQIIASHAIQIIGYHDAKTQFTFANSWGTSWGDKGYGYLPYEFFEKWFVEAFIVDGVGEFPSQPKKGIGGIAWETRDFSGRVFYAREFYDADTDERIGWAFAVQRTDHLGVEELYVRPQFRRQGYGTRLLQSLRELSTKTGLRSDSLSLSRILRQVIFPSSKSSCLRRGITFSQAGCDGVHSWPVRASKLLWAYLRQSYRRHHA